MHRLLEKLFDYNYFYVDSNQCSFVMTENLKKYTTLPVKVLI